MSIFLDKFINLFKWPVAVYMFLCLPALCQAFHLFIFVNNQNILLCVGIVFFIFSKTMMDVSVRTSMQVIAHEFTHVFFALLTFHKIKHIRIHEDDTGGEMGFLGHGNWLITIAPYFFPLFCIIFMIFMNFISQKFISHIILGYFLAYHIDTVFSQIHPEQTDLKKVGYKFCFIFLPGINLCTIEAILAFNLEGLSGVLKYFKLINGINTEYIHKITQIFELFNTI